MVPATPYSGLRTPDSGLDHARVTVLGMSKNAPPTPSLPREAVILAAPYSALRTPHSALDPAIAASPGTTNNAPPRPSKGVTGGGTNRAVARIHSMMKTTALALCLLATPLLHADPVPQLQAALAKLHASSPLAGTVTVQKTLKTKDGDDEKAEQSQVTLQFDSSASGLSLIYPPALLEQLRREEDAKEANPDAKGGTRTAMNEVDPIDITELADQSTVIKRMLMHSKLIDEKPGLLDNRAVRILEFAVTPSLSKSEKKHIKSMDVKVRLWVNSDSVPLLAEINSKLKFSFLLISADNNESQKVQFVASGDHLVAVRREIERSGSGLGQSSASKSVITVALK